MSSHIVSQKPVGPLHEGREYSLLCMAAAQVKLNLNPGGYIPNVTKEKDWGMLHGMDVNRQANFILASLCVLLPMLSSSIAYCLQATLRVKASPDEQPFLQYNFKKPYDDSCGDYDLALLYCRSVTPAGG